MMLSDVDIQHYLKHGGLEIDPIINPDLQFQPASVDLTLDNKFIIPSLPMDYLDGSSAITSKTIELVKDTDVFQLYPGDFVLASTQQRVKIPDTLAARVEGRSSLGRRGLLVHITAGFIDPGFEGKITLELANISRCAVTLKPGMRISQLCLFELKTPCQRPYGAERGSKYVGGQQGPERARVDPV